VKQKEFPMDLKIITKDGRVFIGSKTLKDHKSVVLLDAHEDVKLGGLTFKGKCLLIGVKFSTRNLEVSVLAGVMKPTTQLFRRGTCGSTLLYKPRSASRCFEKSRGFYYKLKITVFFFAKRNFLA
jgi:hypothetical protein